MAEDRSPNWSKWQHIPEVMLWQAVALSLNIDPASADESYSWKAEETLTGEAQEFKDRLDVLIANFNRHPLLRATSLSLSDPAESSLLLGLFAAWADTIPWDIPAELTALGVAVRPAQTKFGDPVDHRFAQLWTLLEAAYLLAGEVPPLVRKGTMNYIGPRLTDEDVQFEQLAGVSERNYRDLKDATDLGHLEFVESRSGAIGNRRVEPGKCVSWAMSRGLKVPEYFNELAIQIAKPVPRPSLVTKEKESLLTIVIAMAIKGYKYDPRATRNDAVREITQDAVDCGLSIDVATTRKWLKEAADLVPAEALERILAPEKKGR